MKRTPIIPSEPLLPSAGPTTFAPVVCSMENLIRDEPVSELVRR